MPLPSFRPCAPFPALCRCLYVGLGVPSPSFWAFGPFFVLRGRFRLRGLHVYSACHGPALGGLSLRSLRGFWRFGLRLCFPPCWPVHCSSLLGLPVASVGEMPVRACVCGRLRVFLVLVWAYGMRTILRAERGKKRVLYTLHSVQKCLRQPIYRLKVSYIVYI